MENTKNEKQCAIHDVSKRCIYTELGTMGYSNEQIIQLFKFMETLPIHYLSEEAKQVKIMICKGQVVAI